MKISFSKLKKKFLKQIKQRSKITKKIFDLNIFFSQKYQILDIFSQNLKKKEVRCFFLWFDIESTLYDQVAEVEQVSPLSLKRCVSATPPPFCCC